MSPGYLLLYLRVLICFFSQRENPTRHSLDVYFHSVLPSHRQKNPADPFCVFYKMSSFSESKWMQDLDRLFWFLWHFSEAQSWVDKSCFLYVRGATFTLTVGCFSTELWIKNEKSPKSIARLSCNGPQGGCKLVLWANVTSGMFRSIWQFTVTCTETSWILCHSKR